MADNYKGPCLIGGDFNEIMNQLDKWGSCNINNYRASKFADCIHYCNLLDLGYKGLR